MSDIFIAHVEEDADVALEIALGLEEAGYTTWCYEIDSMPGPSYLVQTGEAVEASKAVVVVISPHSVGSRQVTREIVRAHESGKEFVPVLQGITHIEFQNRQPEWREAVGAAASIGIPQEGVAVILPRIIKGLRSLDILPSRETDAARIVQIREALGEPHRPDKVFSGRSILPERAVEKVPERTVGKVTYNRALRWISGIFGSVCIVFAIGGLSYFAEYRLGGELIVDMITIIIAIVSLLMAIVPQWVSAKFKIKLEKGTTFGIVLGVLVIILLVVTGLSPEPPGGW